MTIRSKPYFGKTDCYYFIKVRENLKIDGMLEGVNDDSMSVHIQKPKDGLVVCTHFPLTN